jgi:hypothetical protein
MSSSPASGLYHVLGSSSIDVFTVGVEGIKHYDGSAWSTMSSPSSLDAGTYVVAISTNDSSHYVGGGYTINITP